MCVCVRVCLKIDIYSDRWMDIGRQTDGWMDGKMDVDIDK